VAQLSPEDRDAEMTTNGEKASRQAERDKESKREAMEFRDAEEVSKRESSAREGKRPTLQDVCRGVGITKMEYKRLIRATEEVDASRAKDMLHSLEIHLEEYNGDSPDLTHNISVMEAKKRIRALSGSEDGVRLLMLLFPA